MKWVAYGASLIVTCVGLFVMFSYYTRSLDFAQSNQEVLRARLEEVLYICVALGVAVTVLLGALVFLVSAFKTHARAYAYHLTRDIANARDQLRRFYEFSPVPYLIIKTNGTVARPNKAALRLFGLDEDHLIGVQLFDLLMDPDRKETVPMLKEQVQRGMPIEQKELQVRAKHDEERWVLFYAEHMPSKARAKVEEQQMLVSLVDIHEQKELERIKTEFLSLASHQLRAPLANLKWSIDFLLTRRAKELTEGVTDYLRQMFRRNEEMIDLVNTLLNLSRVEMGRLKVETKELDVVPLVESILEELAPVSREKSITIVREIPTTLVMMADTNLLRIVLQNLMTNALRYTPNEGTVTFTVVPNQEYIEFRVSDSGIGIPLEEQGRIFTKMYRATNAQAVEVNGNGIGLYMCKAITEALGGEISFVSVEHEGTVFTVKMPAQ